MNFITGWYAYALYGDETLQEGLSLYARPSRNTLLKIKTKWERRGWQEVATEDEARALGVFEPGTRMVGDRATCIVKLNAEGGKGDTGYKDTFVREASWVGGFNQSGTPYFFTL